jgi:hypothetical protein
VDRRDFGYGFQEGLALISVHSDRDIISKVNSISVKLHKIKQLTDFLRICGYFFWMSMKKVLTSVRVNDNVKPARGGYSSSVTSKTRFLASPDR